MIMATNEMGERYSDAKLNVSWLEGEAAKNPTLNMAEVRSAMEQAHRAWPSGSRYADSNFPALLDRVEQAVKAVKA